MAGSIQGAGANQLRPPGEISATGTRTSGGTPNEIPGRTSGEAPTDGRVARGIRARETIAEALIALLEDGVPKPTAKQVAQRAGVSLRLVFHHFEDMESLLRTTIAIQAERHWHRLEVSPDGDLETRIREVVRRRADLFEAIAPVRRAASQAMYGSPTVAHYLEAAHRVLRGQLRRTFSEELARNGASADSADPHDILDALEVVTSFETWDNLTRALGRSYEAAVRVMERLAAASLGRATGMAVLAGA
jgi:TetR/AcrR family transcriptional regulator, regulator of autoinduction and epiphytic fitness